MRLPDIPAIALGALGLACLSHVVEPPAFVLGLASNTFIASCLEGLAKYSDVCSVSLYVAAIALILSGILRIWLDNDMARWIWAVGSVAVTVPIMAMLNETVFAWAWDCDLYSAGTTKVVLTVFHFCWMIACPLFAAYGAMATQDFGKAMPFWVIPACGAGGFLASLVPYAALLLVLIPLNYLFAVVDTIFIVLAFIVVALFLKFGIL